MNGAEMTVNQNTADWHTPGAPRRSSTLLALFGAPVAWVIQMSLSEPLAAYGCYPHQTPLVVPLWAELSSMLAAISLLSLSAGLIAGYIAWDNWRCIRPPSNCALQEKSARDVDGGQTRFLATLGMMSSLLFVFAILFTGCAILLVPPCGVLA